MRKEKMEELHHYIEEMKTLRKKLLEGPSKFLTVEQYSCLLNNGKTIRREKLKKQGKDGNAVIILPITKDGTTIITVQPRVFTKSTVGVGLPAGYVEEEESYENAAKRELLEETGYRADHLIECSSYYQDDGCSASFNKGYVGLGCQKVKDQNLDKDEYIRYLECRVEELLELVEQGYIQDGGSQLLIERAKKYL